jgi:hypothetical protein
MFIAAILFFALAAIGGLGLAYLHWNGKNAPIPLALAHGALAVIGVILLLLGLGSAHGSNLPIVSLIIFILAAIGGIILFSTHMKSRPLPRPLIAGHGALAVTAFLILLIFVARSSA